MHAFCAIPAIQIGGSARRAWHMPGSPRRISRQVARALLERGKRELIRGCTTGRVREGLGRHRFRAEPGLLVFRGRKAVPAGRGGVGMYRNFPAYEEGAAIPAPYFLGRPEGHHPSMVLKCYKEQRCGLGARVVAAQSRSGQPNQLESFGVGSTAARQDGAHTRIQGRWSGKCGKSPGATSNGINPAVADTGGNVIQTLALARYRLGSNPANALNPTAPSSSPTHPLFFAFNHNLAIQTSSAPRRRSKRIPVRTP